MKSDSTHSTNRAPLLKKRRDFLKLSAGISTVAALWAPGGSPAADATASATVRETWVAMLRRVAEPVLTNLAENQLKARMPIEAPANTVADRRQYTHLEALGRTLTGLAPWLEMADKPAGEAEAGTRLAELARRAMTNATNPEAADYLNFSVGAQPLVDTAFLAHALIRAPRELWQKLDPATQPRVIACLQKTRAIKAGNNNWLLFAAMVETALASVGAPWQAEPIEKALSSHDTWYKGDGTYGDGADLHWDYYNSFVIHPMLVDVLEHIGKFTDEWKAMLPRVLARAKRYAAVQERLIAPDGTYPPTGRSLAYRCGAFQLLAQMALRHELPAGVAPAQVRGALSAVIRRTLGAAGTFDDQGWLRVGVAGHQPGLAEAYISTGSLYLCSAAFLPLGLPASDPFWADADAEWTQRKLWSGQDLPTDHALASSH